MLRDSKFPRRKNANGLEPENVPVTTNDSFTPLIGVDPSRPALTVIPDPAQVSDQQVGSIKGNRPDRTPTKLKRRYADIRTPEKQGRFGWSHKSEHQSSSGAVEYKEEGRVLANMNTPSRSTRGVGRANSSYSECNSAHNTPTKSVSKPSHSGFCMTSGSRPPLGNGANRMVNFAAMSKGVPSSCSLPAVVNTVEVPCFELKEDSSFWMEHNVQVLIRVRPLNTMEKSSSGFGRCLKQDSSHCVTWIGQPETQFTFDHVACEAIDQETLFRMVGLPMVENCLSGYNSCMFAYGQTGSGKTHTMLGEIDELEVNPSPNRGMTPRIFEFLFARIREEEECRRDERLKYNCKCSFLEIYNEQITDLLNPLSTNLLLREDVTKGVYVENLSEFEVHTVTDVLQLLSLGSSNRRVAATNMNRESSRSHSVFTCVIESSWEKDSATNFRFARLNLVDLAGSERQKSSGAEGERLKEAASINKSLSTLGHVIMVLVDVANGKPKHVPYRDSRLTFLLQDSLGGNSKTIIIANVSPSMCSAAETLNTLKFAQRAKLIQNNAIINEDSSGDVHTLKLQLRLLKEELSALKREKVHRSLSFGPLIPSNVRNKDEDDYIEQGDHLVDMLGQESNGILRVSCKQLKSWETTLSGAFRREQMAENTIQPLQAEIEQLNRLVSQREEDTRCAKMMLKFREDKIQRLESLLGGSISADDYLKEENAALLEEIQLLRARMDRNPEVTRFAHENIKLLEQVRRFQDLYEEGERELLMSEISELRNQLVLFMDGNSKHPNIDLDIKDSVYGGRENDLIHEELKRASFELESTKDKLAGCLHDNEKLRRELEELRTINAITCATPEHNCSQEVHKESINNQSTAPINRDQDKPRSNIVIKQAEEEILNLQLELDILKIILQEERSYHVGLEQKYKSVDRELQLSKEMILSVTKGYEKLQEEIIEAKLVIESLESQQIQSITEIEDLRNSNIQYEEILNRKELETFSLKEQGFRDLHKYNCLENEDSRLEAKLKKMHESLEKAKKLNQWYQSGLSSRESEEEEAEEVRRQVEAETAEVIVCMQEELSILQQEVHVNKMKEVEFRDKLKSLEAEVTVLNNDFHLKSEENAKLAEMLQDREHELRIVSEEWEVMGCEIEGILSGGQKALEEAHGEIDLITSLVPDKSIRILEQFERMKQYVAEKERSNEELNQCLQDAVEKRNCVESMLRSLREAALVITETHLHECSEKDSNDRTSTIVELERVIKCAKDRLRVASSCATAALVMVNRLSELNSVSQDSLCEKNTQIGEFQEIIIQKDNMIDEINRKAQGLQLDLEASEQSCTKLKLQLSNEQKNMEALQIKFDEIENDTGFFEMLEKLKELTSGVSSVKYSIDEYLMHGGDPQDDAGPRKELRVSSGNKEHVEISNPEDVNTAYNLASKKSRNATIILLNTEIESALGSLQGVQDQMAKLIFEHEEILTTGKHSKENIEVLMNQAVLLQGTIDSFDEDLQLKVNAFDGKLGKMEENLQEACTSWSQQKELLEAELDDARVVATQKTIEASCVLEKFEEVQDTVREADIMINELLIANESLKINAREFKGRETNLISQIHMQASEVESLKFSNNLKDQNYGTLETQYEAERVVMNDKLREIEDIVSEIQTCSMGEWLSLSSDLLSAKSQLSESTKIIRSSLEDIWSEIIVKDCAISVLHLCHMGILLETANGLNAENSLLHHGLCESNAAVSELREHNFRSTRELQMCRVLEGKLLADIKKGYDRVLCKVHEAEDLTLQLTFFEKKIKELQYQEEMMLQRSDNMGSELALLVKELECSNSQALVSLFDHDRLLKDKDELLENREQCLLMELIAKDLESVYLSSELKQQSNTCTGFVEVLENFKKELIVKTLDATSNEFILQELAKFNNSLKVSFEDVMEDKRILYCRVHYLESQSEQLQEELKRKETALVMTSGHISELEQNTQKLQDGFCLLESKLDNAQSILANKDQEMKCLEKENELLQEQLIEHKMGDAVLLQVLEGAKSDFEVDVHILRDNILMLENSIAKLEEDLHQSRARIECYRLSQSVENDLCLKIRDLEMELENANAVKNENICLRNKLDAHEISKSEYINALSSMSLKNADIEKNIELISSKVFDLIAERFIQIDYMFEKTIQEVEKAHIHLEQFSGLDSLCCIELSRKDDVLKGLLFDLSMLQESTSNSKAEMEELKSSFTALEKDFEIKSLALCSSIAENQILEAQIQEKIVKLSSLEFEMAKQQEIVSSLSRENCKLLSCAEDASEAKSSAEKSLMDTKINCENLETEIAQMESALAQMVETNNSLKSNLDAVTSQMEYLDAKVIFMTKELEMARALAKENEMAALEAGKIAELRIVQAEEKEEEVKLLERSIEELECTINVLEQKVDIVNGEAERQRLEREELELELHALQEKMHKVESKDSDIKRLLDAKDVKLQEVLQRLQILEGEIVTRDDEISRCKAHITELNFHAEAQASEYKEKFKSLEAMAEQVKYEVPVIHSANSSPSKLERKSSKPRGSGSPFKCIGLGLVQQIKSERNEELSAGRQRMEELEALASSRQKEILMLKARLERTGSMTHDVIRELLGVKLNISNYATLMDNQQLQSVMEELQLHNAESKVKEKEVSDLKLQISEFIKERNGWLEEIERKQAELLAAHVAVEKLRQQDNFFATENDMLKRENANHKVRVMELEAEMKKLSGQQNLQQRIHHHAKIKDENNLLRSQNEDLSFKLRKTEAILSRVKDELAQFRTANGRSPHINFDEEQRLDKKLKETEVERLQLAQKLLGLCTSVLQAAGIRRPTSEIDLSMAEEALHELKHRVVSLEMELEDAKLKNRISEERSRLSELRPQSCTSVPKAENGQKRSCLSPSSYLSGFDR